MKKGSFKGRVCNCTVQQTEMHPRLWYNDEPVSVELS